MSQDTSNSARFRPMDKSETIGALAEALAKAQLAFEPIHKTRTVKVKTKAGYEYEFKYATLDDIIAATKKALSDNGLCITQHSAASQNAVSVETMLAHASGEWIRSGLQLTADSINPQSIGSALTYARRYALSSLLNVASEEDDDGNFSSGNTVENMADRKPVPKAKPKSKPTNTMGLDEIPPPPPTPEKPREKTIFELAKDSIIKTLPLDAAELSRIEGKVNAAINMTTEEIGECMLMIGRKREQAERMRKQQDAIER